MRNKRRDALGRIAFAFLLANWTLWISSLIEKSGLMTGLIAGIQLICGLGAVYLLLKMERKDTEE